MAEAVARINHVDRNDLYEKLVAVARKKTADADMRLDDRGELVRNDGEFGENVLIVTPEEAAGGDPAPQAEAANQ